MDLETIKNRMSSDFKNVEIAVIFNTPSGLLMKIVEVHHDRFDILEYVEESEEWWQTHSGTAEEIISYLN